MKRTKQHTKKHCNFFYSSYYFLELSFLLAFFRTLLLCFLPTYKRFFSVSDQVPTHERLNPHTSVTRLRPQKTSSSWDTNTIAKFNGIVSSSRNCCLVSEENQPDGHKNRTFHLEIYIAQHNFHFQKNPYYIAHLS